MRPLWCIQLVTKLNRACTEVRACCVLEGLRIVALSATRGGGGYSSKSSPGRRYG